MQPLSGTWLCLCCLSVLPWISTRQLRQVGVGTTSKGRKIMIMKQPEVACRNVMIYVRVLLGQRHKSYLQGSFRFLSSHLCPLMKWFGRDLISGRSKRHQSFWGENFCLKTDNSPRRKLANFKWGQWNRDQNDKKCIHQYVPKNTRYISHKSLQHQNLLFNVLGSSLSEKKRFTLNQLPLFYIKKKTWKNHGKKNTWWQSTTIHLLETSHEAKVNSPAVWFTKNR